MTTFLRSPEEPNEPHASNVPEEPALAKAAPKSGRITSIDAARGFIMLTMIFVNDLAGAPESAHVPTWMQHASDVWGHMKRAGASPMPAQDWLTFVDLVFPGFLFIVGMSIPFAIGGRLNKGEGWWQILPHVLFRSFALILLGMLMAAHTPDGTRMPWYSAPVLTSGTVATSPIAQRNASVTAPAKPKLSDDDKEKLSAAKKKAANLWVVFWYAAAFLAFCQLMPFWVKKDDARGQKMWKAISLALRVLGAALLLYLLVTWVKTGVDRKTHEETTRHLLSFSSEKYHNPDPKIEPGYLHGWRVFWAAVDLPYGNADILGLIGWAYLMGAVVFLCFRNRRLPLAVCTALLLGFWMASFRNADGLKSFSDFSLPGFLHPFGEWLAWVISGINDRVSLGGDLGSQAAITVAGVLLATILWKPADEQKQIGPETAGGRTRFTLWFIAACCFAALLIHRPYLVWKNPATPSWCLWACASTALVWLVFYLVGDVLKAKFLTKPFAVAGQNVLMAYLFSEGADALFNLLPAPWRPTGVDWPAVAHFGDWYGWIGSPSFAAAFSRSLGFGIFLLALTAGLNWLGYRLRL